MIQKCLLIESKVAIDLTDENYDGKVFINGCELEYLMEKQIITVMNMVEVNDVRDASSMFTYQQYDHFAPI